MSKTYGRRFFARRVARYHEREAWIADAIYDLWQPASV
jgi:hypothetical protein